MFNENINSMDYCSKRERLPLVPKISPNWITADYLGQVSCRISNSFRMEYYILIQDIARDN